MIVIIQLNSFQKKWVFMLLALNTKIYIFLAAPLVTNPTLISRINELFDLEFTVGPIHGGGAHKVRASGNGLVRGEVHSTSRTKKRQNSFVCAISNLQSFFILI